MKQTAKILLAALVVSTTPALAAPPSEITSVIKADMPYGEGDYNVLLLTPYAAELWTDAQTWSMGAPFALTLRYHMNFSTKDFVSRANDELRHVAPSLTEDQRKAFDARMSAVFPPVKSGDEITALYRPGMPVAIFHNGQPSGQIALAGFAEAFFGIWLSPNTSAPSLRAKLLRLK